MREMGEMGEMGEIVVKSASILFSKLCPRTMSSNKV